MMQSNTAAATLLSEVIEGLSLFSPPPRAFFRAALNECLTRLYTELVRECATVTVTLAPGAATLPLSDIPSPTGTPVRAEDLLSLYLDGRHALYLPPDAIGAAQGADAPYYTVEGEQILLSRTGQSLRVCLLLRPPLCTEEGEADYQIPLSHEFMPLLTAYLYGEGYRAANEDALAAKWLSEYNHRLGGLAAYLAAARAAKGGAFA